MRDGEQYIEFRVIDLTWGVYWRTSLIMFVFSAGVYSVPWFFYEYTTIPTDLPIGDLIVRLLHDVWPNAWVQFVSPLAVIIALCWPFELMLTWFGLGIVERVFPSYFKNLRQIKSGQRSHLRLV